MNNSVEVEMTAKQKVIYDAWGKAGRLQVESLPLATPAPVGTPIDIADGKCNRAWIVAERAKNCGWITIHNREQLEATLRIALDTEVEAGGPYLVQKTPVVAAGDECPNCGAKGEEECHNMEWPARHVSRHKERGPDAGDEGQEPAFHAVVNPRIVDRVWIASYTASKYAGVLSRGLFFRSIHDTKEQAESMQRDPQAIGFTVTEYAKVEPTASPETEQPKQLVSAWDLVDAIVTGDEKSRYIAAELQQWREYCPSILQENRELKILLQSLANEASGMLYMAEYEMRAACGNTNVNCLQRKIDAVRERLNAK